jgi:transposase
LQAAELLAHEVPEIAQRLRVSHNAVYAWRRRWRSEGEAGLASQGPPGSDCRLSPGQVDQLAALLQQGPAAHRYTEDQRWTRARIAELIAKHFRTGYSLRGVSLLLHRMGFSPQMPAHRPVERDEETIAAPAAGGVTAGKKRIRTRDPLTASGARNKCVTSGNREPARQTAAAHCRLMRYNALQRGSILPFSSPLTVRLTANASGQAIATADLGSVVKPTLSRLVVRVDVIRAWWSGRRRHASCAAG